MSKPATNLDLARHHWGATAPEWITVLAGACDSSNQTAVAKRLNISHSIIGPVLRRAYPGRLDRIEQRVRGELMNERVSCPVLGEITKRRCIDEQVRAGSAYVATNAVRVELRRACAVCPNSQREAA